MCPNEKVCGKKPPRLRDGSEFVLVCRCVIWRHLICIQSGLDRPQVAQHLSGENGYPHLPVWFCCCQLITRPFSPDWKATFNWLGTIGRCYAVKWDFSSSWNQKYFFFPKRFQLTECVPGPPGGTRRRSPSSSDTKFGILMKFFPAQHLCFRWGNFLTSESPEFRSLVGPGDDHSCLLHLLAVRLCFIQMSYSPFHADWL